MRGTRIAILAAAIAATATLAYAGPFSFLFFWRSAPPQRPQKMLTPGMSAEIPNLVSEVAQQKCENWAWAAALETVLKAQHVELPQSYWIIKNEGGELCKDDPADLNSLAALINGEYALDDGRKVRLRARVVEGAPTQMDELIVAPQSGRPLLFFWKGHAYVYRGLHYNDMLTSTGIHEYEVEQVDLLDPFQSGAQQSVIYDRDKDDPADIDGMMDVIVTTIEGPDWQHPEKELDHPTEIFPN